MKTVGIIAEYDPFHRGHLYQLQEARKRTGADCVAVVLGGDFLQRGTPSMVPKAVRARMAIENGADLVLSLPYIYSANSAPEYSRGAVDILAASGAVDFISFGCETDDAQALADAADAIADEKTLSPLIRENLSEGLSYAESLTRAVQSAYGEQTAETLRRPNNLLACEYLKALKSADSPMQPVPVKRTTGPEGENAYVPASFIRRLIANRGAAAVAPFVPTPTWKALKAVSRTVSLSNAVDTAMLRLLRYRAMTDGRSGLEAVYGASEGIEARFLDAAADAGISTVDELADAVKTKRYTRARIMRLFTHILMNFSAEEFVKLRGTSCIRVLAADETGRELLKKMKKTASVPIVSNLSRLDQYGGRVRRLLELDIRAAGLYAFLHGGNDLYQEIKYVPYMV